jgi:hypothetical protein
VNTSATPPMIPARMMPAPFAVGMAIVLTLLVRCTRERGSAATSFLIRHKSSLQSNVRSLRLVLDIAKK